MRENVMLSKSYLRDSATHAGADRIKGKYPYARTTLI